MKLNSFALGVLAVFPILTEGFIPAQNNLGANILSDLKAKNPIEEGEEKSVILSDKILNESKPLFIVI